MLYPVHWTAQSALDFPYPTETEFIFSQLIVAIVVKQANRLQWMVATIGRNID